MHGKIEKEIIDRVPKQFFIDMCENLSTASEVAANKCKESIGRGSYNAELGYQRSWQTSHQLYATSTMHGFSCTESKGNSTAVANINGVNVVRVNMSPASRKSKVIKNKTSVDLSLLNKVMESQIQPDLFDEQKDVSNMFLCIVCKYNKTSITPSSIELFVPSSDAKSILYRVSLAKFLSKYEDSHEEKDSFDKAHPKLKKVIKKLEK